MKIELRAAALVLLLGLPAAAAERSPAGGEFAATATLTTKQGTRSMGFTVVVSNPRTIEEALPLKKILEEGGQQALLNAMRGGPGGQFRLGALVYPIDLVVAEPVKDGEHYLVVTARPLHIEEVNEGRESMNHPFTVVEFVVPEFGRGEGEIFTQSALFVDAEGHVRVEQYEAEPGRLKDVRRVK